MVKVSIVIPVYNRKNFLTVCIKSLLAQSFEDFEICLVDDGSTDGTGLLCDELAEKDTRIRVLHVQNGGAAYARQKGVELATGEWVVFVDSDDTMPAEFVSSNVGRYGYCSGFLQEKALVGGKQAFAGLLP